MSSPNVPPSTTPPSPDGSDEVVVPNVVGLFNDEAFHALTTANLRTVFFHPAKKGSTQPPVQAPDADAAPTQMGTAPSQVVPEMPEAGATIPVDVERDVPKGTVTAQKPLPGTRVPAQTAVTLHADYASNTGKIVAAVVAVVVVIAAIGAFFMFQSNKTDQVATPSVVSTAVAAAKTQITASGLVVGKITEQKVKGTAGVVLAQDPAAGVKVKKGTVVNLVVSATLTTEVPNVVGAQIDVATQDLSAAGFAVGTISRVPSPQPAGEVLKQSPAAATVTPEGTKVNLVLSSGAETVPSVVGLTVDQASTKLVNDGLVVAVTYQATSSAPPGVVLSQDPSAGTSLPDGSTVTLTVSKAVPPAPTPTETITVTPTPIPTTPAPTPTDVTPTPLPS